MNKYLLLDALGFIDDGLVEEHLEMRENLSKGAAKNKTLLWKKFSVAAVCAVLLLSVCVGIFFALKQAASDPSEPPVDSIDNLTVNFNTPAELMTFINSPEKSTELEDMKEVAPEGYNYYINVIGAMRQSGSVMMPSLTDGLRLRDREGFSNITFFGQELYGKPWIWYHCTYNEKNVTVRVMCGDALPEDIPCSEAIKNIAPNAPSPDNYGNYPSYSRIYDTQIALESGNVNAMISELADSDSMYVYFVCDGRLICLSADKQTLTDEFFGSFSMTYYPQT